MSRGGAAFGEQLVMPEPEGQISLYYSAEDDLWLRRQPGGSSRIVSVFPSQFSTVAELHALATDGLRVATHNALTDVTWVPTVGPTGLEYVARIAWTHVLCGQRRTGFTSEAQKWADVKAHSDRCESGGGGA